MVKINKARKSDSLKTEWKKLDIPHYGKEVEWTEKEFRFKAVENGEILGKISGKIEAGVLYISTLITVERARNKGIGTMLIKKVENYGKKNGAHKIWLWTGKSWSENTFYQKLGFKVLTTLPNFFLHTDFVIYTKEIESKS